MAPWWWFHCKPKHVGAAAFVLKCFNDANFFNVVCISWTIKCLISLMHGLNMKIRQVFERFILAVIVTLATSVGSKSKAFLAQYSSLRRKSVQGLNNRLGEWEIVFPFTAGVRDFCLIESVQPRLRSTQPVSQCVPGAFSSPVKLLKREADHSPQSSTHVKNEWSYTSTPLICLHGVSSQKYSVFRVTVC